MPVVAEALHVPQPFVRAEPPRHLHDGARAVELVGRAVPAVARLPGDDDAAVRALGDRVGRCSRSGAGRSRRRSRSWRPPARSARRTSTARRRSRSRARHRRDRARAPWPPEAPGWLVGVPAKRADDEAAGAVGRVERPVGVEARERRRSGALARDDDAAVGLHDRRDAHALRRPGEPLRVRADARGAAVEGRVELAVGVRDRAARQCRRQDARRCRGTQPLSRENRHPSMKAAGPGSAQGGRRVPPTPSGGMTGPAARPAGLEITRLREFGARPGRGPTYTPSNRLPSGISRNTPRGPAPGGPSTGSRRRPGTISACRRQGRDGLLPPRVGRRHPRRGARVVRALSRRVLARPRARPLSRRVRRGADRGRLARQRSCRRPTAGPGSR